MTQVTNTQNVTPNRPEIVSKTKGNYSITVFMPLAGQERQFGVFPYQNDPSRHMIRLNASDHQTDATGTLVKDYAQIVILSPALGKHFASIISQAPDGHLTLRFSAELQVQRNWGKQEHNAGTEYFNRVYVVYGYSYEGQYFTTQNDELSIRQDIATGGAQPIRGDFISLAAFGGVSAAPATPPVQQDANAPVTEDEDKWAQDQLATTGGPKRNTRSNQRAKN